MLYANAKLSKQTKIGKIALELVQHYHKKRAQQGFTLIESLIAIVIVAVVITSFTPAIFLAVGTRIQNRRAEQAIQLAQGEIDKVRRTVERGDYTDAELPPLGGSNVNQEGAPSSVVVPPTAPSSSTAALKVDVNNNGTNFLVQTFRTPGPKDEQNRTVAFRIGVRVYAGIAEQNLGALENPPQRVASLQLTTALGAQKRRPLAIIYTSVVKSDTKDSLCSYQRFLTNSPTAPCQ